jgi:NADH:ubiquinone oxidoreductase subunit E
MLIKDYDKKIALLNEKMEEHLKTRGPLMPTLHDAQDIFGAIPLPVQKVISEKLGVSVAHINGVVTFYSRFSLTPKGKHVVGVCLGTACYVKNSQSVLDAVTGELGLKPGETSEDGLFTVEATRCIGACGLAPVYTVGEEVTGMATSDKVIKDLRRIIEEEKNKND